MTARRYLYATVRESPRAVIYVVRVREDGIGGAEADLIAERMRDRLQRRGEISADVVVVQGRARETLRLHGMPYAVGRVRAAMFNASIDWQPIDLDLQT